MDIPSENPAEILRYFRYHHNLLQSHLNDYLWVPRGEKPIDFDRVYDWENEEEAIPDWLLAQILRIFSQQERHQATLWGQLSQHPQSPLTILLYQKDGDFRDFQPDVESAFRNTDAYDNFHEALRAVLQKLGLADRLMYVPMHRPDYDGWLQPTGQEHSEESLQEWAQAESQKHGSRLEHPAWPDRSLSAAISSLCARLRSEFRSEKKELSPSQREKLNREQEEFARAVEEAVREHDRREVFQRKVRDRETIHTRVVMPDDAKARAQFLTQKQEEESRLPPAVQRLKQRLRELKKPYPVT